MNVARQRPQLCILDVARTRIFSIRNGVDTVVMAHPNPNPSPNPSSNPSSNLKATLGLRMKILTRN